MKITSTSRSAAVLAAALAAGSAAAADLFVSVSGTWKPDGREGTCYTDLRSAINAAQSGDTVWLQDGYVCDSGLYEVNGAPASNGTNGGYARARIRNKVIVLRSESGYVDEATGKGATIRGAWHNPANGVILGSDAVRCLWVEGANARESEIFGLVFEGGSTGNSAGYGYGGGICGDGCIVSNCVFRNNSAFAGGAVGSGAFTLYNCVLTNNLCAATGYGGGAIIGRTSAYDCLIASNRSVSSGGAIYWNSSAGDPIPVYSNCEIVGNVSERSLMSAGGGAACFPQSLAPRFVGCRISGNAANGGAGGVYGPAVFEDCEISGNIATNAAQWNAFAGGVNGGARGSAVLVRCVVTNNTAYAMRAA